MVKIKVTIVAITIGLFLVGLEQLKGKEISIDNNFVDRKAITIDLVNDNNDTVLHLVYNKRDDTYEFKKDENLKFTLKKE